MKRPIQRVCVIGGGPSGIVACKELEEKGFEVECFEKAPTIGGVFGEFGTKSYYTLLNISKFFISYSDHPPGDRTVCRWTWKEYGEYLESYARANGLRIQCGKEVGSIRRTEDTYTVSIADVETGRNEQKTFDAVVVCAGLHHEPRPLPFAAPGLRTYNVTELSAETVSAMKDKDVMLYGLGESTADVLKILPRTRRVFVVARRKRCFGPNIIKSHPPDLSVSRVWQSLPTFVHRLVNLSLSRFGPSAVDRRIARLSRASNLTCTTDFLVKNSGFAEGLLYRDLQVKTEVAAVDETGVTFSDGDRQPIDVIVNCTGFTRRLPQLSIDGEELGTIDLRGLYKHMILPEIGPTLAFLGYAKPTIGNIPATSDMQARYLAMVLAGDLRLPEDMREVIAEDAAYYRRNLAVDNEQLVHYMTYLDSLADQIGCRPRLSKLLMTMDLRLLWYCYMGSHNPFQYRLFGPGSDYAQSREVIVNLPVTTSVIHLPIFLLMATGRALAATIRSLFRRGTSLWGLAAARWPGLAKRPAA
jgi:dimethylaniline monooxygenase (N-oxide forming)